MWYYLFIFLFFFFFFQHWLDPNKNILRQIKSKYLMKKYFFLYIYNKIDIILFTTL